MVTAMDHVMDHMKKLCDELNCLQVYRTQQSTQDLALWCKLQQVMLANGGLELEL